MILSVEVGGEKCPTDFGKEPHPMSGGKKEERGSFF